MKNQVFEGQGVNFKKGIKQSSSGFHDKKAPNDCRHLDDYYRVIVILYERTHCLNVYMCTM